MPEPSALIRRFWGVIPIVLAIALFGLRACLHVDPLSRLAPAPSVAGDPPESAPLAGSVFVARGGPLIIGFQTDGPAHHGRLTVAGRELRGAGLIKERIVVPSGPLAIRFAAAPGTARLVWSPVGRRGDPEYLPASSVSPDPPEGATFERPGYALGDGLVALALLGVLAGSLLVLARKRLAAVDRPTWIAIGAVFVLALAARLIGLGDQGQTWDEDVNWAAGRNYVTNVLGLDFAERSWTWNFEHPPVMKLLDGIGAQLADGFGPARALSALWVSIGCALLVPIGRRLFRLRVGALAGGIAALLPPLVAHGQVVGHESPTVLWWALGVLLALGVNDDLAEDLAERRRTRIVRLAAVGAAVGIAVASRFVNGLLGPLVVVIVLLQAPRRWLVETLKWIWVPAVSAIVVFVAVWPRMWLSPMLHLQQSLAKLKGLHAPEPFLGVITNSPSATYFLAYLAATAPLGVLLGVAGGFTRASVVRTRSFAIVCLWFAIPLVVVASPVRQDGVRYVMPCLLAMAVLAACAIDWLATKLERRTRHAATGLAAVFGLYLAFTLVRAHPYYLDYFGEQTGGAGTVQRNKWFETAWWGEGVDRAVDYVNEHARPGSVVFRDCILPGHLAWFREDLWAAMSPNVSLADYAIAYAPATQPCHVPPHMREVFTVMHDGAVMARVYARP